MSKVTDAVNEGENRYRQTVLGQGPLPGYPVIGRRKPFDYLDGLKPEPDAPISDNPSGLYCPACREVGLRHCAHPDFCGEMRPMRPANPSSR
jgi:hypothetical protein